ncbi:unnamed protein product, partial [Polarella glacialis]
DGELYGMFSARCAEKVEQIIKRLGLEKEEALGLKITLLHGDQFLPPNHVLQDCGVMSGATLTLLRERQSQLQLVALGCGHIYNLDSFFSWVAEDGSPAVQLCSGAVAWCRRFAEDVMDGAFAAVCSLQNPEWMQCRVDSGELSKSAAVKAVLASFIRSLLATGRLGSEGSGPNGAGEACDHEAVTGILREHLPQTARGVNLLSGSESHANLSELFMQYIAEKYPEKVATERQRVNNNLARAFQLDPCEEMPMNIWSDEQEDTVGWRQYLEERTRSCGCSGSSRWCDDCCQEGWMSFLKSVHSPDNMWFQINSDEEVYTFYKSPCMMYQFAVGVYLEGEERGPNALPTHYVVQWARTD